MIKALIVAGNYRQYKRWLEYNLLKIEDYQYIRYPFHLDGQYAIPIYCIGSYWQNPIYKEVLLLPTKNVTYLRAELKRKNIL